LAWPFIGCTTTRVSNLDAFDKIEMNRVVPYPTEEELRKRAVEIVIVDLASPEVGEVELVESRSWSRRELERIAEESGATLREWPRGDSAALDLESLFLDLEAGDPELSGADFVLATRFTTYEFSGTWQDPFKFLWQAPEEVENKEGTCTHRVDVAFEVEVIAIGTGDPVRKTYSLAHSAERTSKNLDRSCPLLPAPTSVLFETAMDQALMCLRVPIGRLLTPRGHVIAHRKAPEADRHLYKISLGAGQGIEEGDDVEIRREQRSVAPTGEEARSERILVTGVVTDQIRPQTAWVAVDPLRAVDEILKGDIARPLVHEGLLSSLSGPSCREILEEQ